MQSEYLRQTKFTTLEPSHLCSILSKLPLRQLKRLESELLTYLKRLATPRKTPRFTKPQPQNSSVKSRRHLKMKEPDSIPEAHTDVLKLSPIIQRLIIEKLIICMSLAEYCLTMSHSE